MSRRLDGQDGFVYLLHFEPAYKHAGHYLGWSVDPDRRAERHAQHGRGARLVQVALEAGCTVTMVRVWEQVTRRDERRMKSKSVREFCPICNPGRPRVCRRLFGERAPTLVTIPL